MEEEKKEQTNGDNTSSESKEEKAQAPAGEKFNFSAEIQKLLQILVHSLYTNQEIFLRELISNAADAMDKVRFRMLTDQNVRDQDIPLEIVIKADKDNNILTISDTGIGMTQEELIENIGTIAHSGSLSFLEAMAKAKDKQQEMSLIGQFGVGFYSVFMVAEYVEILTLSANPDSRAYSWSCDGSGEYTIAPAIKKERGTEIRVHLKKEGEEFLESHRIENIIRRYSDFISFPIKVDDKQANKLSAIWTRPRNEIKEEEYKEFFSYITHMQDKPLAHLHLSYDAPLQFHSILFIPRSVPWDMKFDTPEKWKGINLYVRRIFIQADCEELLPPYLRFVRGIVDSDDLPLNISRENLQQNQMIAKIRKNLVNKILEKLEALSDEQADDYRLFWSEFGRFLKQGYRSEYGNRERLAKLFRFNSSHCNNADETISLTQYIERMQEGQKEIYYISGEDRNAIENSPHLELFKRKEVEVLYLTEPVDDFLMEDLKEFQEKKLVSVDQDELDLDDVADKSESEEDKDKDKDKEEQEQATDRAIGDLLGFFKDTLKNRVSDVRISKRLVGSPCCLVSTKDALGVGMQKLMKMMDEKYEMPKRILEINHSHPLINSLANIYAKSPREEMLKSCVHQLLDNALLLEGTPLDTKNMVPRIQQMMEQITKSLLPEEEKAQ